MSNVDPIWEVYIDVTSLMKHQDGHECELWDAGKYVAPTEREAVAMALRWMADELMVSKERALDYKKNDSRSLDE